MECSLLPGSADRGALPPATMSTPLREGHGGSRLDLRPRALWRPAEQKALLAEHLLSPPLPGASLQCYHPLSARGEKATPQFPLIRPESMLLKNLTHTWLKSQSMHFMF